MSTPVPIRVMISSRSNSKAFGRPLADLRRELKRAIEEAAVFGEPLFEVWINEDAPSAAASRDAWDESLAQVRQADIVLVLYNGEAGWAVAAGDPGICHAELAEALRQSPAKVYAVELEPLAPPRKAADGERDRRFRAYWEQVHLFRGSAVRTPDELQRHCLATLRTAVAELAGLGAHSGVGRAGGVSVLDWGRLDLATRKQRMEAVLRAALGGRTGARPLPEGIVVRVGAADVLFACHAVPAAMTVAAAREMVGQPFLHDHDLAAVLAQQDAQGPVHAIACLKGVTEAQAIRLLGFPDATIVTAPFGVWVADGVQKIQILLLRDCLDETALREAVRRLFEWLGQVGEDALLAGRAQGRRRIVASIAAEQAPAKGPKSRG